MRRKTDGTYQWYRDFAQRDRKDGSFVCDNVDPGVYKVTIRTNMFAEASRPGVTVTSGQETPGLNFVLSAGCSIFGRVTDAAGAVPKGAHVIAQPITAKGEPDVTAQSRTDRVKDDGTYRIRGLKAGLYQVKPMAGGYCQGGGQRLNIGGEQQFQMNLVVNKGGYVKVKVVGPRGQPVSGASVVVTDVAGNKWGAPLAGDPGAEVDPARAGMEFGGDGGGAIDGGGTVGSRTGVNGEFRVPNALCPGPAVVEVSAPGYRKASVTVNVNDELEIFHQVRLRR